MRKENSRGTKDQSDRLHCAERCHASGICPAPVQPEGTGVRDDLQLRLAGDGVARALRQAGGSVFPLIPGYSWVGKVVEIGGELSGWREGDLVTGRCVVRAGSAHVLGRRDSVPRQSKRLPRIFSPRNLLIVCAISV